MFRKAAPEYKHMSSKNHFLGLSICILASLLSWAAVAPAIIIRCALVHLLWFLYIQESGSKPLSESVIENFGGEVDLLAFTDREPTTQAVLLVVV